MNSKKMIRNFFINKDLKKSKQFVHNYVYESNCFTSVDKYWIFKPIRLSFDWFGLDL